MMTDCLRRMRQMGYRVVLVDNTIYYRYMGSGSPPESEARALLDELRRQKAAVLQALRQEAESGWPLESYEAEARFGVPEARLYPFLNRVVLTPEGPGTLLQVLAPEAVVALAHDRERTRRFPFDRVRPVAASFGGRLPEDLGKEVST